MQNYDAIENSKVIHELTVDKSTMEFADLANLYVASSFNGKLKGYIACCNSRDIIVLNLEDGKVKYLVNFFVGNQKIFESSWNRYNWFEICKEYWWSSRSSQRFERWEVQCLENLSNFNLEN